MNYKIDNCPVCGRICMAGEYDHKDKKEVDCERCGKFKISMGGLSLSNFYKYKDGFAILSYYIRNFLNPDELLSSDNINSILENNKLPSYEIKYNKLLTWLANESNYSTKSIADKTYKLSSLIGFVDSSEFIELLFNIWEDRLIEVEHPTINYFKKFGASDEFKVRLTINGIKKVKEGLERKNISKTELVFEYDIVLSFAGEDRDFVDQVVKFLKKSNIKYFYDQDRMADTWGEDLAIKFDNIYQREAQYCVIFISRYYKEKIWTNHELKSALARAIKERENVYILPIRLDDTEIPGIRPTTGFVDGREKTPKEISDLILKKLKVNELVDKVLDDKAEEPKHIPKIKRTISDLEKKKFLKSSFNEIKDYFQNTLTKLKKSNAHIETEFEQITLSKFVATVYVEGNLKSQCKIWIGGMRGSENSISFSEGTRVLDINNDNSLNDSASVIDDGIDIFFDILGLSFGHLEGIDKIDLKHASSKDIARYFWARFTNNLRY